MLRKKLHAKKEKKSSTTISDTSSDASSSVATTNDAFCHQPGRQFYAQNSIVRSDYFPSFAEQILAGPEGQSARRRSIQQKMGGYDSTPENSAPFADQMFAGPQGRNARRQSASYRRSSSSSTKGGSRDSCSISDSARLMMEELSMSNRENILADFEDDSDCEEEQSLAAPVAATHHKVEASFLSGLQKQGSFRPGLKKQGSFRPGLNKQGSFRPGLKKQMSRRLSQTQLKQYGIEDDTENIFASTMCMENSRMSSSLHMTAKDLYNEEFKSEFEPNEMRCLALVAHNHMKPAMRDFVISHKEILRKFRLTGTNTTMAMLREVFGDDPTVQYGPSFASGPLGGDAELCALMCLQDLGGCIFFQDPLSAHPHQADIDCLNRLCNVHNILTANNPCTAHALCFTLKSALEAGRMDMIPSFFTTLKSPGVKVYKEQQKMALEAAKSGKVFY